MVSKKILLVDGDPDFTNNLAEFIQSNKLPVMKASGAAEALKCLKRHAIHSCFVNIHLPDLDGLVLIKRIKELYPVLSVVGMSEHGGFDNALCAIKHGASQFIAKSEDTSQLQIYLEAINRVPTSKVVANQPVKKSLDLSSMIGKSRLMTQLFEIIEKVADTDATVLIMGESGTGKELVARALHNNNVERRENVFVPVNCGAIPEDLLESELFGHAKGAFTGAIGHREGRFAVANGGTIFLDEIGDMPLRLQVKLLRVLQEKRFEPVGSTESIKADVRIVAATNVDLEEMVRKRKFREDLYYRLHVLPIVVPPLRERLDDLPLLLDEFLERNNRDKGRQVAGVADEVYQIFQNYPWPGNVRELENLIERLVILSGNGIISPNDLPTKFLQNKMKPTSGLNVPKNYMQNHLESSVDFYKEVESFENQMILKALERTGWNKNKAAKILNLNRTTLVEKIKKRKLSQDMIVRQAV